MKTITKQFITALALATFNFGLFPWDLEFGTWNLELGNCSAQSPQTFNYTGGSQTWQVPNGVTSVTVDVKGAQGGGNIGGMGGRVQAILTISPCETFTIFVGGAGDKMGNPGGYNGGGDGGQGSSLGGSGGGASDIRRGGTALTDRIVVAGGGGGEGGSSLNGGMGGGLVGGNGNTFSGGGTGGTQTSGGTGSFSGSFGLGSNGQYGSVGGNGGGGGGGGYYGGGGGLAGHGGGGGSSYVTSSGSSNITHTQGYQSGNGQVIITWTGGSACAALPIELLYFTAQCHPVGTQNFVSLHVSLHWATASETNNDYFTIERSTNLQGFGNLEGFDSIAAVKGAGNSSTTLYYEFIDQLPSLSPLPNGAGGMSGEGPGMRYYRLKQTDFNGQSREYEPVSVTDCGTFNLISIFPNPANDYIEYLLGSAEGADVTIKLYDALGREVYNKEETIEAGLFKERINTNNMSSGNYLLRITNGNKEKIQKQFVIK